MNAFLGVKGSPVQIRPSRRRSKAGSGFQLPAFGCNGSARGLPSVAPAKRSGVSCRPGMLTSGYRQSARPRAGSRPSPPTRVSFLPGQGVAGSGPDDKDRFWATTAADGRRPAAATLSRLGPRRPATSSAWLRMLIAAARGRPADRPAGGLSRSCDSSPTVTISTGWHRMPGDRSPILRALAAAPVTWLPSTDQPSRRKLSSGVHRHDRSLLQASCGSCRRARRCRTRFTIQFR